MTAAKDTRRDDRVTTCSLKLWYDNHSAHHGEEKGRGEEKEGGRGERSTKIDLKLTDRSRNRGWGACIQGKKEEGGKGKERSHHSMLTRKS